MTDYRVRWKNHIDLTQTYGSDTMSNLKDAYEYRDGISPYVYSVWIEAARWEIFDEGLAL